MPAVATARLGRVATPVTRGSIAVRATAAATAFAALGLLGRIMSFPLRHDEQMYLPPSILMGSGDLYGDFGFNNLPNLPLLVHGVVSATGADHYLLTGRLIIFAGWLLAAMALGLIVRRATASTVAALLAVLLLFTSQPLLGTPGMLVTNNFLPLPFALLGLHLFIAGVDRPEPHRLALLGSGVCLAVAAGFKANFIFLIPPFAIAALLLPRHRPLGARLTGVTLPLVAGGIIGGLPVLRYLVADPTGFITHVVGYHRGPHIAYWAANSDLDGPKVMNLAGKLQLAGDVWLSGAACLILVFILSCALKTRRNPGGRAKPLWPVALVAALVIGAAAVSFIPTPAFPQYYTAPIPIAIALAGLLYGRLGAKQRAAALPVAQIGLALALFIGAPRLLVGVRDALQPASWTGNQVAAAAGRIADLVPGSGDRIVATLSPLYVIEAGLKVYPELAAGPLVYRVGDLIPAADRRHYRMVSPSSLDALLDARPPAAVLVGFEPSLDGQFVDWAVRNSYVKRPLPGIRDRYGSAVLYVRPDPVGG